MAKTEKENKTPFKAGLVKDTKKQTAFVPFTLEDIKTFDGFDINKVKQLDVINYVRKELDLPEKVRMTSQKSKKGRALLKALSEEQIEKLMEKHGVEVAEEE